MDLNAAVQALPVYDLDITAREGNLLSEAARGPQQQARRAHRRPCALD